MAEEVIDIEQVDAGQDPLPPFLRNKKQNGARSSLPPFLQNKVKTPAETSPQPAPQPKPAFNWQAAPFPTVQTTPDEIAAMASNPIVSRKDQAIQKIGEVIDRDGDNVIRDYLMEE